MPANDSSSQHGHYVQLNDINMYYEEYGNGEPLLLLHGGTQTAGSWEAYIPALSQHFRVFVLDSRGQGRTNNPKGELNYKMMSHDVAAFIQSLELKKPCIFGYSDGAQTALEIGMGHSDLVQALVLCSVGYTRSSEAYRNVKLNWGIDASGAVNFDQLRVAWGEDALERLRESHKSEDNPDRWISVFQLLAKMWLTPLKYTSEDFRKVSVPVLLLLGDRDPLFPVEEDIEMYRMLPLAELAVLPNSGHDLPSAEVELCTQIILAFFQRHRKGESGRV